MVVVVAVLTGLVYTDLVYTIYIYNIYIYIGRTVPWCQTSGIGVASLGHDNSCQYNHNT